MVGESSVGVGSANTVWRLAYHGDPTPSVRMMAAMPSMRPITPPMLLLDGVEPFSLPSAGAGVVAACGRVADHTTSLLAAERVGLERMAEVRRAEYSSGRRVARQALSLLGIEGCSVTARGRLPVWPLGVVGSITHSRTLALAMVGREADVAGIGVDLEQERRVNERVAARVLVPAERRNLAEQDWRTMLFAAKEAVYKAVNPVVGEYLDFGDVEVSASKDGTFTAVTTRARKSTSMIASGRGHFRRVEGHWLCTFLVLPTDSVPGS